MLLHTCFTPRQRQRCTYTCLHQRPVVATTVLALVLVAAYHFSLYPAFLVPQRAYDPHSGLLRPTSADARYAIVTFLGSDTVQAKHDHYYVASRLLTYQLLHANETCIDPGRSARVDVIVAVTARVDSWKRRQLSRDGATVIEVDDVPLRWWVHTGVARWVDQFAKLRLLQWTQYSRVLFIDADSLLLGRVDDIFEEETASATPSKTDFSRRVGDEADVPAEYVFLAGVDHDFMGRRDHAVPPDPARTTDTFSGGFWLAAPSDQLYTHLLSIMDHYRRFDPTTMEQSLMNYVFRRCRPSFIDPATKRCVEGSEAGPMPWKELHWKWSSTWPSVRDREKGVRSLHEKFWRTGPPELVALWTEWKTRMEEELGQSYS